MRDNMYWERTEHPTPVTKKLEQVIELGRATNLEALAHHKIETLEAKVERLLQENAEHVSRIEDLETDMATLRRSLGIVNENMDDYRAIVKDSWPQNSKKKYPDKGEEIYQGMRSCVQKALRDTRFEDPTDIIPRRRY